MQPLPSRKDILLSCHGLQLWKKKVLSLAVTSAVAESIFRNAGLIVAAKFYVGPTPCKKACFYT
jgi:hypothetical protein